jgi:hypothetical protein
VNWSDESRYTMWRSIGRVWVWRMRGEGYVPTVKFGGGGIAVWGFFMEWTWPSRNTARKSKRGRIQGHFDPLCTVYGRRQLVMTVVSAWQCSVP